MQTAKKLVLVDEFDREYKRLQRPADAVAKTGQSLQLSNTLHDQTIADDRKVREYVAALHKYLNLRKEVPVEPKVEPNFGTPAVIDRRARRRQRQPSPPVVSPEPSVRRGKRRKQRRRAWSPW